jgi:lipopolysaccharide transport system permease protein
MSAPAQPLLTIRPPSGWAAINLRELWHFRDLLLSFAARDLKLRYKQTALGVIWVILQPLLAAGVFSLIFGRLAGLPSDGVPYFLFSFVSMLAWNLFNSVLTRSSACLVGNPQLISKIFFPRLVLPLSTIGSALIDFAVGLAMLAILFPIYGIVPGWQLLLLPVWTAVLLMLALGIGLFTAALNVSYRDVQYILPVLVNLLQYLSPVAYSATLIARAKPIVQSLYFLNPLAGILEAFRRAILPTTFPPAWSIVYAAGASAATLWLGAVAFKQMERRFADVI